MKVIPAIGLLMLWVLASPDQASAAVTGVTLSPASPVAPGTTVTVTVAGTNPCGAVEIDFGDGQPVTYAIRMLPFSQSHAYPVAGSFAITAKGQGNCRGQASTTLVVAVKRPGDRPGDRSGSGIDHAQVLCQVLDCPGLLAAPTPRITKVLGVIQAGGPVLIGGAYFGGAPGRVRMIAEGGSSEFLLEKLEWYPSGIGGTIPNVPGVGQAKNPRFVVETSAGTKSNEWPVNWVPVVEMLPMKSVRVLFCSKEGNRNWCSGVFEHDLCASFGGVIDNAKRPWSETTSFMGVHTNCAGAVGDDEGADVYEIDLKNGWVLHELTFASHVNGADQGSVTVPSGFVQGSTYWKASIPWSVTPSDEVAYWGYILIRGPKGVPH